MARTSPLLTAGANETVHLAGREDGDCPAVIAGYRSFWAGQKMTENPFDELTKEHADFERGWRHGHAWSVADAMPH